MRKNMKTSTNIFNGEFQIVCRAVHDNSIVDIYEGKSARLISPSCSVWNQELHVENNFALKFLQVEGFVIAEIQIVWGIPLRCRKPRPLVCIKGVYTDLQKFVKNVDVTGVGYLVEHGYALTVPKKEVDGLSNAKPLLAMTSKMDITSYKGALIKDSSRWAPSGVGLSVVGPAKKFIGDLGDKQLDKAAEPEGMKIERQARNRRKADRRQRRKDRQRRRAA